MRAEKLNLTKEYVARLNASPFFIVASFQGLNVGQLTELRKRLFKIGAEFHVVKNSVFRIAAKEAGIGELGGTLTGMLAVVTGQKEISATAKVLKNFAADFDKLKINFGFMGDQRIEKDSILALADLPSIEVLRGKFLGLLQTPATNLLRLLNTPATQLARVLQGRGDQLGSPSQG
jgi:large subunit ribosomal protein L10